MEISLNSTGWLHRSTIYFALSAYHLSKHTTVHWRESLMIAGMITSIIGIAHSFFNHSRFQTLTFALLLSTCTLGYYYIRQFFTLKTLETTVSDLKKTQQEAQSTVESLQQENTLLHQTNQELSLTNQELRTTSEQLSLTNISLQTTNQQFQATHSQLSATNLSLEELNRLLTQQVAHLTLQVTQLTSSAEKIHQEMTHFQSQNSNLNTNVSIFNSSLEKLSQEIATSHSLCNTIDAHFKSQQTDFSNQILELKTLISELKTDRSTNEKLEHLSLLNKEIRKSEDGLNQIQLKYFEERMRFEEIGNFLNHLKEEFCATNRDLQVNIKELNDERIALREVQIKINVLVNQFFPKLEKENLIPLVKAEKLRRLTNGDLNNLF